MPLPKRFESYRGFVIYPDPFEFEDYALGPRKWVIAGYLHPESDPSAEERFQDRGKHAGSYDEAVEMAIAYGKRLVDARLGGSS